MHCHAANEGSIGAMKIKQHVIINQCSIKISNNVG